MTISPGAVSGHGPGEDFLAMFAKHSSEFMSNFSDIPHTSSESKEMWFESSTENYNDSWSETEKVKASPLDNWWNVFDEQYLRHSLTWTLTLLVAYSVILIMGVLGNFMVILVVVLRPQMRTVTNMFIMNLAVADLFVVVFCVPATFMANVFTPWILGSVMCKGVAYVQGVSVCASAYSLAAISFDRCKAIYRPLERPLGLSKLQAFSTICFIWIIALLITLPWAVIFNVITSPIDGLSYCLETWENERDGKIYFFVANLICCYCLPLVLISLSNIVIWCHVSHRKVPQDSASVGIIKKIHRQTRQGVRKMLGIVTLTFLLSWLPLYALVTRLKFSSDIGENETNIILDILMPCAQWLGSWNSSINPVLYAFLNSRFREMFKSLLPRWCPFLHKDNRTLQRNAVGRGTLTNVTIIIGGTNKGPSYTTVITAGTPACSRDNSRRLFRGQHQHNGFYPHSNTGLSRRTLRETNLDAVTTTVVLPTRAKLNAPFIPLDGLKGSCGECSTAASRLPVARAEKCYGAASLNTITEV